MRMTVWTWSVLIRTLCHTLFGHFHVHFSDTFRTLCWTLFIHFAGHFFVQKHYFLSISVKFHNSNKGQGITFAVTLLSHFAFVVVRFAHFAINDFSPRTRSIALGSVHLDPHTGKSSAIITKSQSRAYKIKKDLGRKYRHTRLPNRHLAAANRSTSRVSTNNTAFLRLYG